MNSPKSKPLLRRDKSSRNRNVGIFLFFFLFRSELNAVRSQLTSLKIAAMRNAVPSVRY